ncbi:MAG TPA: GGDEF domain-containing protein [Xanthobacteraceae bacterium]
MDLDVNTLFMVTMQVEIILGLLLFFAWAQNFSKRALAWWGSAHLLRAVSIMLLGLHGSVPNSLSIDFGNAVLFASFALTWCGARVFDRRAAEPALALIGVAIWLVACRVPAFAASPELRLLVGSGIVTAYTWLAAYEFWRSRDEALVSRWPAIFMLFTHGSLFLLRTPIGTMSNAETGNGLAMSGWLELLSLEGLMFTISIAFILLAMAKERTEYHHRTAASTDALTGIANRRGFLEQAMAQRAAASANSPVAVLLFDIDHFKRVNDRFGHPVGDRTLQIFAETAKAHIGELGTVGRWGGDEFVAVLFDTSREIAATVGERIQRTFEDTAADIDGRVVGATVSTGVAFSGHGPFELPALLLRADQALYQAKEDGRNRLAITMSDIRSSSEEDTAHIVTLRRRDAA